MTEAAEGRPTTPIRKETETKTAAGAEVGVVAGAAVPAAVIIGERRSGEAAENGNEATEAIAIGLDTG